MANKKQYASVTELLRDVVSDEEIHAEFSALVARRQLIKQLIAFRALKGMSQEDVAAKMGCTQGSVSKLEGSNDDEVRLGTLRAYAKAVGCELAACPIPQDITPVERVKCHAFAIKRHTDDMAQLARKDERIAQGVTNFFLELLVNLVQMLSDSADRLPLLPGGAPRFRLHAEVNLIGEDEDTSVPPCIKASDAPPAVR